MLFSTTLNNISVIYKMSIDITSRWKQKDKYQCSKSTLYLDVCCIHLFAWRHTNLYSEPVWGQFRVNMFNRPISNESTKSLGIKGEYTLRAAVRLINAISVLLMIERSKKN
jgi:hypothetical protein